MKENSIKEDIKIIGNILHKGYTMSILHPSTNIKESEIKALEHILSDYKRALKENEQLSIEVNSLKEENETLKNNYENLNNSVVVKNHCIKNSIPVQKVEDKIEKLNNETHAEELEDIMNIKSYTITELVQYVLQELLEGRK